MFGFRGISVYVCFGCLRCVYWGFGVFSLYMWCCVLVFGV